MLSTVLNYCDDFVFKCIHIWPIYVECKMQIHYSTTVLSYNVLSVMSHILNDLDIVL